MNDDRLGLLVLTRNREEFSRALTRIASAGHIIDGVIPSDENVDALYEYLIGGGRSMTAAITKVQVQQAWGLSRGLRCAGLFYPKRGLWVYLLAFFPAAVFLAHGLQVKVMEERWARHGLASAQLIDSFTKGEKAEDVLKRAPHPSFDHKWTNRRDDERETGWRCPRRQRPERARGRIRRAARHHVL